MTTIYTMFSEWDEKATYVATPQAAIATSDEDQDTEVAYPARPKQPNQTRRLSAYVLRARGQRRNPPAVHRRGAAVARQGVPVKCPRCGSAFEPKMATQSFCSPRCRIQANAIRQQRRRVVGFMVQFATPCRCSRCKSET